MIQHGMMWWVCIIGAFVVYGIVIAALQLLPSRFRRTLIYAVTFIGGLFFSLEFFWPTHKMTIEGSTQEGNFLTPLVTPFANMVTVVVAMTVGLGVINLFHLHGRKVLRGQSGWFNSLAYFVAFFAMVTINILQHAHPNSINKNLNAVLFFGAYTNMDATMFSLVAFYIVSAAYRAFRVRSVEASLLLVTAVLVMIGQTALGQLATSGFPHQDGAFTHNFRVEVIRDWLMTKANAPAIRAIAFGLGIGNLAVALRIWLGLERGSYFDGNV